ncbi:1-(5-phosphoribosyl)-5-[(5- phosphoribosylamino)methylideneamino] imidazole-4-carboxamide isomerase [Rubrobacter xylanophilus DSM 9941]|uniref:1-(5-phosphoribosyl)-5-[(5- phosphoribosylamino)methylideneamino]imidazole-4- carboxamide isomerase n=1 Tax=Rubrobacter xylanophilus TaxID=49319 RepID=UPI001C6431AD|nr:1-(5-phosphoribosyl)-5-[(5-phosphoribosylamino)methylideneamino]imidazole-4-carboxamide isomerase [Rubrobacter xylanophilus]QYJ14348.1 1-(5-phosphoribosyl)-5-[(5- phosphoribosylamino)methylideneamino] imidazole-4-carboxamide isomerase [Rubrobacter xylanophilus DSM 9941]
MGSSEPFVVFPAVDLRGGRCVRLKQGDFARSREYDADPVRRAREWERQGARALHVVDLDGAREGRPVQLDLIRRMAAAVEVPLQVGGGIRTPGDVRAAREAGVSRVVVGTAAVADREFRLRALEELGGDLVVAVDAREGVVATHGWREESGVPVTELAAELAAEGVPAVLFTDISRDGTGEGVALERTAEVASIIPTIASGGVRGVEDIRALRRIPGVVGAVVGTALYEGTVTLEELLVAAVG